MSCSTMPEPGEPFTFRVLEVGCLARPALTIGARGEVSAIFERSFYIALAGQWLCLGPEAIGNGPLNLRCDLPAGLDWRASGLNVGDDVDATPRVIRIVPRFAFALTGAADWSPRRPEPWSADTLGAGLDALAAVARDLVPSEGLGRLAFRPEYYSGQDPTSDAAAGPATELRARLRLALATGKPADLSPACGLLGLGPGLTPSGDDYLGGVMVALHLLGRTELAEALWKVLRGSAPAATNAVSLAHLSAAAQGLGGASLHAILNDVLSGRTTPLPQRLARIDAIGHCSGWDALTGTVDALRAWLAVRDGASRRLSVGLDEDSKGSLHA